MGFWQRKRYGIDDDYILHNQNTDPVLNNFTAPLPATYRFPPEPWGRRFWRGVGHFFAAVIRKFNQLLGLVLAVLLLLLFTRFMLTFFDLKSSLFAQWIFWFSTPLTMPFDNFLPVLPYNGFLIDVSILVAIVVYTIIRMVISAFLKILVR